MGDSNYKLNIINHTGFPIFLTVGPWDDSHSSCITIADGSPGQLGSRTLVLDGDTMPVFFWRSGSCHGEQGWLAVRAAYDPYTVAEDYQQFWFDAGGGFDKHGRNASYQNELSFSHREGDTAIYNLSLRGACARNWPDGAQPRPLDLRYVNSYDNVWDDRGSGAIFNCSIWRPRADGYYTLGYTTMGPASDAAPGLRAAVVARPLQGGVLLPPERYEWIGDDHNSGAARDCSWWRPIPPRGYVALGTAFSPSHDAPAWDTVWCVRADLVGGGEGGKMLYADALSGATHDLSIFQVRPTATYGIDAGASVAAPTHHRGSPPKLTDGGLHALCPPAGCNGLSQNDIEQIIARRGPVLRLHPDEGYLPMAVDPFIAAATQESIDGVRYFRVEDPAILKGDLAGAKAYVFANQVSDQFTDLRFWFFYGNNGETFIKIRAWGSVAVLGSSSVLDKNADNLSSGAHVGDWEHVILRVDNQLKDVVAVGYSSHGDIDWFLPNGPGKIDVYSALHMHGCYPAPGEHLELAGWETREVSGASLQVAIYSRNLCDAGGPSLDCSVAGRYEIVASDFLPATRPKWLEEYADWRWGQPSSASDEIKIVPGFSYTHSSEEIGPGTPRDFRRPGLGFQAGQVTSPSIRRDPIHFPGPMATPLGVAVGLNQLDMGNSANVRISVSASEASCAGLTLRVDSWADSILYHCGASWIARPTSNGVRMGGFNTQEVRPWYQPTPSVAKRIEFDRPYDQPPEVVVWLNQLDMANSANCRVTAYASDVDARGFTIHVDTWADSVLYMAGVSWIAFPKGDPRLFGGSFGTQQVRPWYEPRHNTSGGLAFPVTAGGIPQVAVGLNLLDLSNAANLRINAGVSGISGTGLTWHIDSWADTVLYAAGASYVAMVG